MIVDIDEKKSLLVEDTKLKKLNSSAEGDNYMLTADELTKILLKMDSDSYSAAMKFIYFLMEDQKVKEDDLMNRQKAFIKETAEKISIDEDAVNELRMGSMI